MARVKKESNITMEVTPKILGLDNGYNFIKTSEGVKFASTIKKEFDDINQVIQMDVNGVKYVIGDDNGTYVADADKLKSELSKEVVKITTLGAIAMSFKDDTEIAVNLIVGLPIAYYTKQKDTFRELMLQLDEVVEINKVGHKQHIKVVECSVYPQSTGLIFQRAKELKNDTSLVVDIGGGTWDLSQFKGLKLEEKATYQKGMLVLYSEIAQFINKEYYTKFTPYDIYDISMRGWFKAEGEKIEFKVVEPLIKKYLNEVITSIKRDFRTTDVDNIFLIGGGAVQLFKYIKELLPYVELIEDAQFINADAFAFMGKMKALKGK